VDAPDDPERMIMGTIKAQSSRWTMEAWTEWLPADRRDVSRDADDAYPYRALCFTTRHRIGRRANRSDFGQITFRDWFRLVHSKAATSLRSSKLEFHLLGGLVWNGTKTRSNTNQISTVFVPGPKYRYTWETPSFSRRLIRRRSTWACSSPEN